VLAGAPPIAEPPDDIAVEEGEPESLNPTTQPDPPPKEAAPPRGAAAELPPPRKKVDTGSRLRGRMTLRIPDDEVARPTSSSGGTPPPAPPSRPDALEVSAAPQIVASRIITINPPPPPPVVDELAETAEHAAPPDSEPPTIARASPQEKAEDSWTPFQPTVEPDDGVPADPVTIHDVTKSSAPPPAAPTPPEPLRSKDTVESEAPRSSQGSGPDIVIEEDIPPEMAAESIPKPPESVEAVDVEESEPEAAAVAAAAPPAGAAAATATAKPADETIEPDEIGLKSEPPPLSEPTELAEVSPEDFVSISAAPLKLGAASAVSPAKPPTSAPNVASPSGHISKPPAAPPKAPPPVRPPPLLLVPGSASPLAPPPMNEAAAQRRRARPWWEDLFNDDFIRTMAKVTDAQIATEVNFIEESLGLAKGAVVLDMACGTGRHAIEMTRRGYQVVGFDLSLAMLARAADEAQERDQKLNFVQGDMREMTFEETFDGVYAWNTSFGFFEEEKNNAVISNVHRALKAGGLLLLDVANRDYLARQSPSLAWFEGDGCVCMDEMHVDWITSRMRVKRTMMLDDGRTRESDYSIRVYALHELGKILHDHGFRVAEVSGRVATPGVFFGADSPRILVVAEKR